MRRRDYHPKAFLLRTKNICSGLEARTRIVELLERSPLNANLISEKSGLSYSSVLHHLHLMEKECIVARSGKKPYKWRLTGVGQKRLIET
ncbi:winged helix-turn-helix transcriptional regulator [Candidatus Bathyarchaeota archaeon]|nr:winged helix-turn-helix transcriptional regulator [Candidatus Bathyarchaeota archaeon]